MSSLIFNARDVFEIAKRIERNGQTYYRKAAELMPDADGKKLMIDLAEMEVVHEQIFDHMQRSLSGDELGETMYDPHDEAYEFLKGMADKYVFDPKEDPLHVLKAGTDARTILSVAIQREKDSIIFYEGIKVMVPQKFGGARLDEIIGQEMGHIIILARHLDRLTSPKAAGV
jgi:rubrerythrin